MLGESLTVEITGDSSQLDEVLARLLDQLSDLGEQAGLLGNSLDQIGQRSDATGALQGGLERVSGWLDQVLGQVVSLDGMSITLNVAPALQSLGALSQMIQQVMAQLAALSAMTVGVGVGPDSIPMGGPIRQFASGGLVTGPAGVDRVPARLSAGEYVLQTTAVERIGIPMLDRINEGATSSRSLGSAAVTAESTPISNHFGDIRIDVQSASDLGAVLREVQRDEFQRRMRRG